MQMFELLEPAADRQAIAFSPDGRMLAVSCETRVFLIDTGDGTVRAVGDEPGASCARYSGLAFTADGRGLIVHRWRPSPGRGAVTVYDLETDTVAREFPNTGVGMCEPAPNGKWVYLASGPEWGVEFDFVRWNPRTGEQSAPFRGYTTIQRLAGSADGKWLAGSGYFYPVRVWNLGGKKLPRRPSYHFRRSYGNVVGMALSADGALLAIGEVHRDRSLRLVEVRTGATWEADGQPNERGLAFHPSRPLLAHGNKSGEVAFYDAVARTEVKRFAWDVGQVSAVCYSADGLRCAAAGESRVVVWDVDV